MRIACWSGPRNISTALMRSWSSRNDTFVSDEPFYAFYLKETGLKHPMAKEIIAHYPNTYEEVINSINKEIPESKKIWYQKHMAHHLINLENIEWIKDFHNCFLIRHPKDVISSYIRKNILVIDASDLLNNPEIILNHWCNHLNILFDKKMLHWNEGFYSTDGIWGEHWYNNIIKTTKFEKFQNKSKNIPKEYYSIYDEALGYYKKLSYFVL